MGSGRRAGLVLGATALATVLCVLVLDGPAATFSHHAFAGAAPFVVLTHLVDPLLPLSAIGFLLVGGARVAGWGPPPWARLLFCTCVATLLAIMLKDQLKYAFGRTWPETWVNANPSWIRDGVMVFAPFHGGTGWSSFPSGHMATVTAPAAVLMGVAGRRIRALLATLVGLVALGLYGADYHFLGDLLAGMIVGAVCAGIAVRTVMGGEVARPPVEDTGL